MEAGESLGFLPGDLKEKVDPYLRPIYDALNSIFGAEHTERLMDRGTIEIAPLAYMRGRTLDNAFVILDEAQNTTNAQMKMFLTRLGFGSKMVVNGDISQIDLPRGAKSGLIVARRILRAFLRSSLLPLGRPTWCVTQLSLRSLPPTKKMKNRCGRISNGITVA